MLTFNFESYPYTLKRAYLLETFCFILYYNNVIIVLMYINSCI